MIAVLDLQGKRLYSSPSYKHSFWDPERLKGTDSFQDIYSDDSEHFKSIFYTVVETGAGKRAEYRIVQREGKLRHLESQVSLVRESDGSPAKVVVVSRDITERKEAEKALLDSERRYRLLFQANPHPMWFYDSETLAFLDVNDAAIHHYGYTRDEFLSMTIKDVRPSEELPRLMEDIAKSHIGIDVGGQWKHRKKDGTIISVEITTHEIEYSGRKAKVVLVHDITRRQQVEQELKKLSSAIEQTADSILITDKMGVIEYVNPAFEASTGYSKEFAIGKTPAIVKSGKQGKEFYEVLWATIRSGHVFRGEIINKKRNGELFHEQLTISPVFDVTGTIIHFVGAGRDITEHKRLEQEISESEQRFRELTDTIKEVFWLTNSGKTEMLYISRGYEEVWGRSCASLLANPASCADSIHPDDRDRVIQSANSKQASGEYNEEYRILRPDGAIRWIHDRAFPVRDQTGAVTRIAGVAEDITVRKQAEEALVRSEERYRSLFEESKDGLFISTIEGQLIDVNSATLRIFGYDSKEEVLGLNVPKDVYVDESDREKLLGRLSVENSVEDFETVVKRKDGQRLNVMLSVTAVRDAQGNVSMIRGLIRDVTRQRQLEQQLIQSQKMESLGTLAGGIAHDFNNILGIIVGHATLLEAMEESSPRLSRSVEVISKSAQRGAGLVRQLLTFARKTDAMLESVMINEVVKEIVKLLEETIPKVITVTTDLSPRLPSVVADVTQIHQVLLNLSVNARDAMLPKGGTLSISTKLVANEDVRDQFPKASALEYVLLTVTDTGMGMDDATRRRIFEPFFTTKERGKGTGLGLATVYGIVEGHNGFIDVVSEPGRGTSFLLYFPILQQRLEVMEREPRADAKAFGGTETILLVEDEEMLREPIMDILQAQGYSVITADDGIDAVGKYSKDHERIDLVITDLGLPKLGGEALIKALKEIDESTRIIVASGHIESDLKVQLRTAGVIDFINKPFRPKELLGKVRQTLDKPS